MGREGKGHRREGVKRGEEGWEGKERDEKGREWRGWWKGKTYVDSRDRKGWEERVKWSDRKR